MATTIPERKDHRQGGSTVKRNLNELNNAINEIIENTITDTPAEKDVTPTPSKRTELTIGLKRCKVLDVKSIDGIVHCKILFEEDGTTAYAPLITPINYQATPPENLGYGYALQAGETYKWFLIGFENPERLPNNSLKIQLKKDNFITITPGEIVQKCKESTIIVNENGVILKVGDLTFSVREDWGYINDKRICVK